MFNTAFLGAAVSAVEDMNILQYIEGEILDGQTTLDVTLDDTVNLAESFIILLGASSPNNGYAGSLLRASFLDANTARFQKGDATSSSQFRALIVNSKSLISLQFVTLSITLANASTVTAITSVNSIDNRVVVFPTASYPGANGDRTPSIWPLVTFADSTNVTSITTTRLLTGGTLSVNAFVAEFRR